MTVGPETRTAIEQRTATVQAMKDENVFSSDRGQANAFMDGGHQQPFSELSYGSRTTEAKNAEYMGEVPYLSIL